MSTPRRHPREASFIAGDWLTVGAWLTPLAGQWVEAAAAYLFQHTAVARVTVVSLRGSAPREPGASMLVDLDGTLGTIGGGRLEWQAIQAARELLRDRSAAPVRIDDLILGPDLGQCCGGRVELWLERLTRGDLPWLREAARRLRGAGGVWIATEVRGRVASHRVLPLNQGAAGLDLRRSTGGSLTLQRSAAGHVTLLEVLRPQRLPLWIFGAGHVGQALIQLLSPLDLFDVTWVDSRPGLLPLGLPDCVTTQACATPTDLVRTSAPGAHYVVLTHDHALDYELCRLILARGDAGWLGLIGSASKAARFRSRLLRDGIGAERLSTLNCPIGIAGIASKLPAAIAIAIAAQLLQRHTGTTIAEPPPNKPHAGATVTAPSGVKQDTGATVTGPSRIGQPACGASCESCGAERNPSP
jgi:xanthine dehydrogenase accessory factor